jgi:hypothetical protein
MVYSPDPPYEVLRTKLIDFPTMQRIRRFARYWDLIANSGHFLRLAPMIWAEGSPFWSFMALSDWLYALAGRTHARVARAALRARGELPRARRADQPSRPAGDRAARAGTGTFAGTLLLVTHDRALLDAVTLTRRIELEDGRVTTDQVLA